MTRPLYRRCTRCGHYHCLTHSLRCAMCWGGVCGDVLGSPADESVEVCDDGGDHA